MTDHEDPKIGDVVNVKHVPRERGYWKGKIQSAETLYPVDGIGDSFGMTRAVFGRDLELVDGEWWER